MRKEEDKRPKGGRSKERKEETDLKGGQKRRGGENEEKRTQEEAKGGK